MRILWKIIKSILFILFFLISVYCLVSDFVPFLIENEWDWIELFKHIGNNAWYSIKLILNI